MTEEKYKVSGYCEHCKKVVYRLNVDRNFGYWNCPECNNLTEMEA